MTVLRIAPNIPCEQPGRASAFYRDLLGLDGVMDGGWIVTCTSKSRACPQVSFAVSGGSGTGIPDLSVEVDDVDGLYDRAREAGFEITYAVATEPWGIRRFHVRDPFGRTVNILSHCGTGDA